MIKKISSIRNVGRFRSFSCGKGGEFDFSPITVIYGLNTYGKSTLVSILKSLSKGNNDLIVGRKSFGAKDDQQVTVQLIDPNTSTEQTRIFTSSKWDKTYPDIVIFDSQFVSKNVYVNESINGDNEKSIESIVLGEEGRKLLDEYITISGVYQKNINRKTEITNEFNRHLGEFNVDFDEFRKLSVDSEIEEKIKQVDVQIKSYSSQGELKTNLSNFLTEIENYHLEQIKDKLSATLETNHGEIKAHILKHLKGDVGSDEFFSKGIELLKDDDPGKQNCVFCGQLVTDTNAIILIDTYKTVFSELYQTLTSELQKVKTYFEKWIFFNQLDQLQLQIKPYGVDLNLNSEVEKIEPLIVSFKNELELKTNLNYKINFSSIDQINNILSDVYSKIGEIEKKFSKPNPSLIIKLKEEKKKLELIKCRSEKLWDGLCDEYRNLESVCSELATKKLDSFNRRKKYSEEILTKYESDVNSILESLNADFRIADTKPKSTLRDQTKLFSLKIKDNPIIIDSGDGLLPSFENSLSESDKRMLAFAFFIASLSVDDVSKKTIVLDDPFSSFDIERKVATVLLLNKIITQNKPQQIIILTHEPSFIKMLHSKVANTKYFKLNYFFKKDTSIIDLMNINDEFMDKYYQYLTQLKEIENAPEINSEYIRPMRDILEELFKKKYYFRLKEQIQTKGSISTFIDKLEEDKIYDDEKAKLINDLTVHLWNHDDSTSSIKKTDFSTGDLKVLIGNFFQVIEII